MNRRSGRSLLACLAAAGLATSLLISSNGASAQFRTNRTQIVAQFASRAWT